MVWAAGLDHGGVFDVATGPVGACTVKGGHAAGRQSDLHPGETDPRAGSLTLPWGAVAVQVIPVSADESNGSLIVPWATVLVLVLVTVMV